MDRNAMTPEARAALRSARPFSEISDADRHKALRLVGMHSPNGQHRLGVDAFDVRPDVNVGEAIESAANMINHLAGTLDLAVAEMDQDYLSTQAVHSALMLARQALGLLAVVRAAAFLHPREDGQRSTEGQS